MPRGTCTGFSLIEVLVALAVFGLAVLGLLNLAGESTRSASLVESRTLAGVVADNRAVEAMIATPEELALMASEMEGEEATGGHLWRWRRMVSPSSSPGILRIDVTVMPANEDRVAAETSLLRTTP